MTELFFYESICFLLFLTTATKLLICACVLHRGRFISTVPCVTPCPCSTMCQCPISGALHFYSLLLGLSCFSLLCQCPISGALHFYKPNQFSPSGIYYSVNALYRAHFISTLPISALYSRWVHCVNALYRAHFIST